MAKQKNDELAKREEAALAAPMPNYVKEGSAGLENMRAKDLVFPRVCLMQDLSPKVKDGLFKAGTLVHSLTGDVVCERDETRKFVPIQHFMTWIEWNPRNEGGGIKEMSSDPNSELAHRCARREKKTVNGKEVFAVTEYHTFLVVFIDRNPNPSIEDVICISAGKSNHKHGKKLLNLARFRGNVPLFAGAYSLGVKEEHNKTSNSDYWALDINNAGWAPEGVYSFCEQKHKEFKTLNVSADMSGENESEGPVEDPEL